MALQAGRVGIAKDQVDEFGHITGGSTPENVYTKSQCDNKFELKSHIGGLKFRDNDGTAQYMLPNGEWTNFSSGGSEHIGWFVPPELLVDTGCTYDSHVSAHQGGYYIDNVNHILYLDFILTLSDAISNNSAIVSFSSGVVDNVVDSISQIAYHKGNVPIWGSSANCKLEKSSRKIYSEYSSYFTAGDIRLWSAISLSV